MQLGNMLRFTEIAAQAQATSNLLHSDNAPIKGIRAQTGTNTTPSVSFAQDTDTGMFNPGPNTVGVVAGSNIALMATSSNVTMQKEMVVSSNIMPADNAVQMIGSSNLHFKEAWIDTIHISQNTLYLGDTPVLGTESDSVAIRADLDQSINVKTTGLGVTNLTSTKGVNVAVSGLNSVVDLQSSGAGGRVVMGATTEVALNAPTTTIGSNLTVQGNLTVNGTQFTANVQTVEITDNILLVNKGQTGSGVSAGYAGIRVDRGDAVDYDLVFNETTDKFEMGPVGSLVPIATEAYALPKTGGTLTGALTGTSATFDSLGGGAISSSVNSTASNVAASSAAVKAAYDRAGTVASFGSNPTITGATLDGVTKIPNGSYLNFGPHTWHINGKKIALYETTGAASNTMQYYGFGMSANSADYMVPSINDRHSFYYATGDTTRNTIAMFNKDGLNLSGGLYGSAISSAVNSTASNIVASSAAVKAAYDGIGTAQNAAVFSSNTAVSASNAAFSASNVAGTALPILGGTMSGTIISTAADAIKHVYGNTGVFYRNDGSDMYILKTATGDPNGSWDTTRPFRLNYANGDIMIGQKLGIGTALAPTERLEVNGNIKGSNLTLDGRVIASNAYFQEKISVGSNLSSLGTNINDALMSVSYNEFYTTKSGHGALCLAAGDQKIMFLNSNNSIMDTCMGSHSRNSLRITSGKITDSNYTAAANINGITIDVGGSLDSRQVIGSNAGGTLYLNTARKGWVETGSRLVVNDIIESFSSNSTSINSFLNSGRSGSTFIQNTISLGTALAANGAANFRFADMRYQTPNSNYYTSNYAGIGFWANDDILTVHATDRVGINTTSPTEALHVVGNTTLTGNLYPITSTTLGTSLNKWGQIYSTMSTISTSDDRLKVNESFIENAMSTLKKLRPQVYDKYFNLNYTSNDVPVHESGLIAQEVFYDAPELRHIVDVPETADSNVIYTTHIPSSADPKNDPADYSAWGSNAAGIRYEGFIPYIIKALQEKDMEIQKFTQEMATNLSVLQSQFEEYKAAHP